MKRHAHKLDRQVTATINMGLNYPTVPVEVFPGDSFRLSVQNLSRFLPQVAPTMHDVNINIETYQVPYRQLFDKLGLSWDDFLTGGEDGLTDIPIPLVTTPPEGYEPGSLADFLGIPTNYMDVQNNVKIVQPSIQVSALPVICYMHVINENYRDQNFVKKLDLTRYQDFLDGTYEFENIHGEPLGYNLFRPGAPGLFPRAWSRDYFGRAMPNTQRGPISSISLGDSVPLFPTTVSVQPASNVYQVITQIVIPGSGGYARRETITIPVGAQLTVGQNVLYNIRPGQAETWYRLDTPTSIYAWAVINGLHDGLTTDVTGLLTPVGGNIVDLSNVVADISQASQMSIIQFRLAARMQQFGEMLQDAGARAVEYTMKFFGVRIPDERIQRPVYHGAFRLPVAFSEVLQTAPTTDSPLAQLAGHGITGGQNKPIHIKVIEHGFIIHIISAMPRSQYHNILPRLYLRKNRFDIPNPIFATVGEQAVEQIEIFPRTSQPPGTRWGYVPRYSELGFLPSTVHGHMKDTFAHWHMARMYNESEPQLSAAFRYELPTNRSFAIQDEDQMQIALGFIMRARRPFPRNPRKGIHIV